MNHTGTIPAGKKMHVIQKSCIVLLLLFAAVPAFTQSIVISGRVTDRSGKPVAMATIFAEGLHTATITNSKGEFRLLIGRCVSPLTISFSATGYLPVKQILQKKDFKDSGAVINFTGVRMSEELSAVTVVSTALGVRKEPKELGYASTKINNKTITAGKATGVASALNGKISSVSVSPSADMTKILPDAYTVNLDDLKKPAKSPRHDESEKPAVAAGYSAAHAGMLTAGEVNDFKKWSMWTDYSKTDFEAYSDQWGLYATHRYSVQLQNNEFGSIVGEKIYLVDRESGDTLWTAVSDNTGKAELWDQLTAVKKPGRLVIVVQHEKKDFPAESFTAGVNHIMLNRSCNISDKVQIAFLVDATGSMQDEINYLKEETEDVLEKAMMKNPAIQFQTGAVFYRDKGDAYLTKTQSFSAGIKNTVDFIKKQNADGGGDYPESVDAGLDSAVNNMAWDATARTKIIFLLMDAPPHGEAKDRMAELIRTAAMKGIRIVPVACSGTDKMTEFIMRSIALATNGTYLFLTDDSGIGNSHIKPTTDEITVEHLNDLMQRTIEQMCFVNPCGQQVNRTEPVAPFTNTFKVKVYPNPTSGPVTLESSKKIKEIFVTDFTGKILMRAEVKDKSSTCHVDLSGFPSAVYLIRYTTEDNIQGTEKVVLMR